MHRVLILLGLFSIAPSILQAQDDPFTTQIDKLESYQIGETTNDTFLNDGWNIRDAFSAGKKLGLLGGTRMMISSKGIHFRLPETIFPHFAQSRTPPRAHTARTYYVAAASTDPRSLYEIGVEYYKFSHFYSATKTFDKLRTEHPDSEYAFRAKYWLALIEKDNGNLEVARFQLQEFLIHHPESSLADNAKFWLAKLDEQAGNYEEAKSQLEQLRREHPASDMRHDTAATLAMVYEELAEYESAIKLWRTLGRSRKVAKLERELRAANRYRSIANSRTLPTTRGPIITAVQRYLKRHDYFKHTVDGVMGPLSRDAISAFAATRGQSFSGLLTTDIVRQMGATRLPYDSKAVDVLETIESKELHASVSFKKSLIPLLDVVDDSSPSYLMLKISDVDYVKVLENKAVAVMDGNYSGLLSGLPPLTGVVLHTSLNELVRDDFGAWWVRFMRTLFHTFQFESYEAVLWMLPHSASNFPPYPWSEHQLNMRVELIARHSGVSVLAEQLHSESVDMPSVIRALGWMRHRPSEARILELLRDGGRSVRNASAEALVNIGEEHGIQRVAEKGYFTPIVEYFGRLNSRQRSAVKVGYSSIGDTRTREKTLEALEMELASPNNQRTVLEVISLLSDHRLAAMAVPYLMHPLNGNVAARALRSVGWRPGSDSERVHQWVAEKNTQELRRNWHTTKSVLSRDLKSGNMNTIGTVVYTFIGLGNEDAIPILIEALDYYLPEPKNMLNTYANAGNERLTAAASRWAVAHGYYFKEFKWYSSPTSQKWGAL